MNSDNTLLDQFQNQGWCRFPHDPILQSWVDATIESARSAISDPANAEWLRYQGTWFAGVNVLPNDIHGAVAGGPSLGGEAIRFIRDKLNEKDFGWDRGQVSVCYPGYPKSMPGESEAAFNFRLNRDAAHIDGLIPVGEKRRRFLQEPHAFILGIPLNLTDENASPLSLWQGSHIIMNKGFKKLFAHIPPQQWEHVDITDDYQELRRRCFDCCDRITVHARPGECYLLHRHLLHGMSPWNSDKAAPDGRIVVYFRPLLQNIAEWLN